MAIGFNVYRAMGSPEFITLFYDAARRLIGFAPAARDAKRAFKLAPEGGEKSNQMSTKPRSFFSHYGIEVESAMRFEPRQREGLWCIELDAPTYVFGSGPRRDQQSDAAPSDE